MFSVVFISSISNTDFCIQTIRGSDVCVQDAEIQGHGVGTALCQDEATAAMALFGKAEWGKRQRVEGRNKAKRIERKGRKSKLKKGALPFLHRLLPSNPRIPVRKPGDKILPVHVIRDLLHRGIVAVVALEKIGQVAAVPLLVTDLVVPGPVRPRPVELDRVFSNPVILTSDARDEVPVLVAFRHSLVFFSL